MPNHRANAKFLIDLAQKGRSLAPHIPKRYSDMVGLFWAVNRELYAPGKGQGILFRRTSGPKVDPTGLLIAGFFPGSIFDGEKGFVLAVERPPSHPICPIARWKLYTCFLSIADDLGIVAQWGELMVCGRKY